MSEPLSPGEPPRVTISTMPDVAPVTGVVRVDPVPRRRSAWVVATAVLVTLAAIGAGLLAVVRLRSDTGGAATPVEAVEGFLAAAAAEDLLGVFDMLLPAEHDLLRNSITSVADELRRLGVLSDAADLSSVSGVEVSVEGVRLVPTTVAEGLVSVEVRGQLALRADLRRMPFGDRMLRLLADLGPDDALAGIDPATVAGLRLAAVEHAGRWYVSLGFTVAEALRRSSGLEPVPPEAAVRPFGSPDPGAAVDQLLRAVATLDLERLIAILDPGEAAALQRYAPLFLDEAQARLDGFGLRWVIDDVAYEVEALGRDRSRATIQSLSIEGTLEGEDLRLDLRDGCAELTIGRDRTTACAGGDLDVAGDGADPEIVGLLRDLARAAEDAAPFGITVTKVASAWYVSPVGTLVDLVLGVLSALNREQVDGLIDRWGDVVQEALASDPVPGVVGGLANCVAARDADAVAACVQEGLAEGRFVASDVPVELRFPECGLVDAWLRGYSGLSDEEFVATISEAHLCFGLLAFGGTIDPFEIPYEARDPDCFGGVNPYAMEDLRAADRVFAQVNACLSGD